MLTLNPYDTASLQPLLDEVAALVPQAIGLRNDPLVSSRFIHPVVVNTTHLEMETGKNIQIKTPQSIDQNARNRLHQVLEERLALTGEKADRFIDLIHAIVALNNIGGWPLRTTQRETLEANDAEVGTRAYGQGDYLSETVSYLVDTLENVDSLLIRYCEIERNRRWRAWVSFTREQDTIELASIDTSAIALHLESMLTGRATNLRDINVARVKGWAAQLGCKPEQMPKILHILTLYVANLNLTRVDLD